MLSISRVAVTGITGHLGYVLTSQLIEKGYGGVRLCILAFDAAIRRG